MANVTDDFNRADVSPLGGNWVISYGDGHQIISNAVGAVDATGPTISYWDSAHTNFNDHQTARATLSALGAGADYAGVAVNVTSGGDAYLLIARYFGEFTLYKVVAETPTYLADWAATITATDNFDLTNIDGLLTVNHNSSLVGTYDDTGSPLTGGQPGIYYDYQNNNTSRITTFYAEDDAAAPGGSGGGRLTLLGVG